MLGFLRFFRYQRVPHCSSQPIQHSSHEIGYKLSFPTYLLQPSQGTPLIIGLEQELLLHLITEDI
jgi:hypothetical protein